MIDGARRQAKHRRQVRGDGDGLPLAIERARSRGIPALGDAAPRRVVRRWRFQPATGNGRAVEVLGRVPVDFRLDHGWRSGSERLKKTQVLRVFPVASPAQFRTRSRESCTGVHDPRAGHPWPVGEAVLRGPLKDRRGPRAAGPRRRSSGAGAPAPPSGSGARVRA
ncbi:MAG: energy transducer TonB [Pseudomonadota bacterium]